MGPGMQREAHESRVLGLEMEWINQIKCYEYIGNRKGRNVSNITFRKEREFSYRFWSNDGVSRIVTWPGKTFNSEASFETTGVD